MKKTENLTLSAKSGLSPCVGFDKAPNMQFPARKIHFSRQTARNTFTTEDDPAALCVREAVGVHFDPERWRLY
jgi:hypothetical protein